MTPHMVKIIRGMIMLLEKKNHLMKQKTVKKENRNKNMCKMQKAVTGKSYYIYNNKKY